MRDDDTIRRLKCDFFFCFFFFSIGNLTFQTTETTWSTQFLRLCFKITCRNNIDFQILFAFVKLSVYLIMYRKANTELETDEETFQRANRIFFPKQSIKKKKKKGKHPTHFTNPTRSYEWGKIDHQPWSIALSFIFATIPFCKGKRRHKTHALLNSTVRTIRGQSNC